MERLETKPGLELQVIGPAQPGVGGPEPFPSDGGVTFGPAQAIPVGGIRGMDLGERVAGGGLSSGGRRDLRAKCVALFGEGTFAFADHRHVGVGTGHPLLGQGCRRFGADPPVLGVLARCVPGGRGFGQAIAAGAQLAGAGLPGGERGARFGGIGFGLTRARRDRRGVGVERLYRGTCPVQLGGEPLGLRFVPGRLADDGLEPPRDEALGLLGRSPVALRPALLGAGRLDGVVRRLGRRRQAHGDRP
jgi:hypothetical protein